MPFCYFSPGDAALNCSSSSLARAWPDPMAAFRSSTAARRSLRVVFDFSRARVEKDWHAAKIARRIHRQGPAEVDGGVSVTPGVVIKDSAVERGTRQAIVTAECPGVIEQGVLGPP